jgi:beta-phosphoglucomutase family hydrolase
MNAAAGTATGAAGAVTRERFDAVLFDLDGVLTDTARVHARCWKEMFDAWLRERAARTGDPFRPFEIEEDYHRYVDGKARADGVRDFLASRGISLPEGRIDSPPEEDSVRGLGNRKDALFDRVVDEQGVDAYPGSLRWLKALRAEGVRTAVVSASHHCEEILRAVGIEGEFEARVDGNVADARGLAGKPAPDTFLEAARALGVAPERAVVVEDALSGVAAGRAGGFGLVVGVARKRDPEELARAGADLVVRDLAEMLP